MKTERKDKRSVRRLAMATAMGAALLTVGACSDILEIDVPGNMTEADLLTPASAAMLINSTIADFECSFSMMTAYNSGYEDLTWRTSGYWTASASYSGGRPGGGSCTGQGDTGASYFSGFQRSRWLAETAYDSISVWTDADVEDRSTLLATAAVYAGLHYQIYGETYCEYSPAVGPMLTPKEVLGVAEGWFTSALSQLGSGDVSIVSTTSLRQLALLGRARTRLSMGDLAGAAADATQIQPGFVAYVTRDATVRGRWNAVAQALNVVRWRTIGGPMYWWGHEPTTLVSAGYYDLTIAADGSQTVDDGTPDPRVPVIFTGEFSQDGKTDQYNQQKYTSIGDDQHLARYAEAQLILAEVEIAGGSAGELASAVSRINALRDVHSLPNFASTDNDEIYRTLIEERRREFLFEGRHHADKLRYGLWFPHSLGEDHKGFDFGSAYCLLMPTNEYELNENLQSLRDNDANYDGPDLDALGDSYDFELKVSRTVVWPVPSSLP